MKCGTVGHPSVATYSQSSINIYLDIDQVIKVLLLIRRLLGISERNKELPQNSCFHKINLNSGPLSLNEFDNKRMNDVNDTVEYLSNLCICRSIFKILPTY